MQSEQRQTEKEIMKRKLKAEILILRAEIAKKKVEIELLDFNVYGGETISQD